MKNKDEISLDFYHKPMCEVREDPESLCNCGLDDAIERNRKQVAKWIYNYYRTLKQEGLTEKKFIIGFESYLRKISE